MLWLARLFILIMVMALLTQGDPYDDEDQGDDGESR
jgi:hypothetical protein